MLVVERFCVVRTNKSNIEKGMGISEEQPMQAMYWWDTKVKSRKIFICGSEPCNKLSCSFIYVVVYLHHSEKFEPSIPGGLSPNIPEHQAIQWGSTHSYYHQQQHQPIKEEKTCKNNNNVKSENETGSEKPELRCGGCGNPIQDRYYLSAVDKVWHADCLKCVSCCRPLASSNSCFSKGNMIYCRDDYFRLFGCRRCGRCSAILGSQEMVLRARDLVFHTDCFTCRKCEVKLEKGDTFGLVGSDVFCRQHYEVATRASGPPQSPFPSENQFVSSPTCQSSVLSSPPPLIPMGCVPFPPFMQFHGGLPGHMYPGQGMDLHGIPPPQKGRPRKRRAKLESMSDPSIDPYGSDSNFDSSCQQQRTKRMRTSFKHHQLRMLKSYFQTNHNPDAKDLKQLSQKTGLSKRVLQVWFQNARAKWRRVVQKTDSKLDENSSENLTGDEGSCSMFNENPGSNTMPSSYEYLS